MSLAAKKATVYESANVDVEEANAGLAKITERLRSTWPDTKGVGRVLLDFGMFANVVDLGGGRSIATCTDGVGTKALIAQMLGKYDTIGIDCVAMNVNDLVCVGATPLTLVDYIQIEHADRDVLDQLSIGLEQGAHQAGVSVSGGEIAELRDMVRGWNRGTGFDFVGTAVGPVATDSVLVGEDIVPGDVVIGISSSGVHANGLSLARKVLFQSGKLTPNKYVGDLGQTIGEELLEPTNIYVNEALEILQKVESVKAFVHITSDGFLNLTRVAAPVGFEIDNLPLSPPVFELIMRYRLGK